MSEQAEQVEREALLSAYKHEANDEAGDAHIAGFIAGRTLDAGKVREVERAVTQALLSRKATVQSITAAAIEAAWLLIEGEDT